MTTSNLALAALSLLSSAVFAQDYQTIKSNSIPFFITTGGDYFLANRIDQVQSIGTDSTFYPFQSIRENDSLNSGDPCKYYLGHSWMGEKIEIHPNGENVFYNKDNESITIQTLAALSDTFNVYTYQNGDWIDGTVSSILEVTIFGEIDTIKTIDLFSNAPLNLTDPRFVISKNHGIIELFAPYSFPEPYEGSAAIDTPNMYPTAHTNNFSLVGINGTGFSKPTIGGIHDFNIGDQHQFSYEEEVANSSYIEEFEEIEIQNKFVWGNDSVVYFITRKGHKKTIDLVNSSTSITQYPGNVESISYSQLDQWQNDFLPEEFNGVDGWNSLFLNECGDVEERVNTESISWQGSGSCLEVTETPYSYTSFIEGVGVVGPTTTSTTGDFYTNSELVFYVRASGGICGNKEFLNQLELPEINEFSLFPNPSNTQFSVQLNEMANIRIFDLSGKQLDFRSNCNGIQQFNLDLESGIYLVEVSNATGRSTQKMEVSH
ncbi:MAG: hypothetical protein BM555_03500 [Crocinitomix sp. MedPE-SWsnd]|nr:MAG: hypothetical protein BM555_03500 [Crocinitomix sp. MedPE-SWsnd]